MTEQNTLNSQCQAKFGDTVEDWSLYAKFEKGDKAAFHQLFDRYKNRIFYLSYRFVKNTSTAEDIAQDVLIKVYEKKVEFRQNTKCSTWIYRVTANASLDHIRQKKFFGFSLNQPMGNNDEQDATPALEIIGNTDLGSPSKELEKKELKVAVENALQTLPERLRIPIILFQFEENSYQEIAGILQISVKAVERRIYRAKEILRDILSPKML